MQKNIGIVDIETIPDDSLPKDAVPQFEPASVKVGNLKDPDKIEIKIAEAKAEFESGLTKRMSLESDYCRIVSAAILITDPTGERVLLREAEYGKDKDIDILHWLGNSFARYDVTLMGWNLKRFDIPIIWKRGILQDVRVFTDYRHLCNPYNDESIDLMLHWNAGDYGKLIDACRRLGIPAKSGLDGSMIYHAYLEDRQKEILDYNLQDVDACLEIARKIWFPRAANKERSQYGKERF